ncbi:MAG: hypothetical protein M1825_002015 [Sarcosagium campestre]|nr:MAG: hypothetical protein M1825_002015 [Sarcosagium campestre]
MPLQNTDEYEMVGRSSLDSSSDSFNLDEIDPETQSLTKPSSLSYHRPRLLAALLPKWATSSPLFKRGDNDDGGDRRTRSKQRKRNKKPRAARSAKSGCLRRRGVRHICFLSAGVFLVILLLVTLTSILNPSYEYPPVHYSNLRERMSSTGKGNPNGEKVFIAANIVDERLIRGAWGNALLELIALLGEENVFLSIYENDSGPETEAALRELEHKVKCKSSIVSEHMPLDGLASIKLPSGEERIKRIAYLAKVRNQALRPLDSPPPASARGDTVGDTVFDKLLFLNDVVFSPQDAAQLLFSTRLGDDGRTTYRAACAVDFINPFKFYDTYATRDAEGFSMGVPFFPWFSNAGAAESRQDVLDQSDAVRVRSCWGGMVAFEAEWFQRGVSPERITALDDASPLGSDKDRNLNWHLNGTWRPPRSESGPVRFRSEPDMYWEASECCLVHADIQPRVKSHAIQQDSGIYVNPYVRVAYGERTFAWLATTRRWERIYAVPHRIVNAIAGLPFFNPRRLEVEGEEVREKVWVADGGPKGKGAWSTVSRTAGAGGFCGGRRLQVLKKDRKKGEKIWESLPVPPL